MAGVIYGVGDDDKLVRMEEAQYETEDVFQRLLEAYPDLLAGEQMNQDAPRRWVLVGRELIARIAGMSAPVIPVRKMRLTSS